MVLAAASRIAPCVAAGFGLAAVLSYTASLLPVPKSMNDEKYEFLEKQMEAWPRVAAKPVVLNPRGSHNMHAGFN
eukprot:scaffold1.g5484.t1